jgi:hypothetical protein
VLNVLALGVFGAMMGLGARGAVGTHAHAHH